MHTPECREAQRRTEQIQDAFAAARPSYCKTCGGIGATFWSDPDVGLFNCPEPCLDCEGHPNEPICAICAMPGDFSERTYDGGAEDVRPCGCDTALEFPPHAECACWADDQGLESLYNTEAARDSVTAADSGAPDDETLEDLFAMSDQEYDRVREQAATRQYRGRD